MCISVPDLETVECLCEVIVQPLPLQPPLPLLPSAPCAPRPAGGRVQVPQVLGGVLGQLAGVVLDLVELLLELLVVLMRRKEKKYRLGTFLLA